MLGHPYKPSRVATDGPGEARRARHSTRDPSRDGRRWRGRAQLPEPQPREPQPPEPQPRVLGRPQPRLPRVGLCLAALAVGGASLAACGGSGSGSGLTLYNGQHVQTTQALVDAFEKQTGITVKVRNNDEDTFADQIMTEGGNSPAD